MSCIYLNIYSMAAHMIHSSVYNAVSMLVAVSPRVGSRRGDGDEHSQRCEGSRTKPLIPYWAGTCPQIPGLAHSAAGRGWAVVPEFGKKVISTTVSHKTYTGFCCFVLLWIYHQLMVISDSYLLIFINVNKLSLGQMYLCPIVSDVVLKGMLKSTIA